jgi:hypothetical protein
MDICTLERPATRGLADGRIVTCHLYDGEA